MSEFETEPDPTQDKITDANRESLPDPTKDKITDFTGGTEPNPDFDKTTGREHVVDWAAIDRQVPMDTPEEAKMRESTRKAVEDILSDREAAERNLQAVRVEHARGAVEDAQSSNPDSGSNSTSR